jgi:hypothetical protein
MENLRERSPGSGRRGLRLFHSTLGCDRADPDAWPMPLPDGNASAARLQRGCYRPTCWGEREGSGDVVTDIGNALRATSDALMRDLGELTDLEETKRSIQPGDPQLVQLAQRIEVIAARLFGATVRQRELSTEVEALVEEDDPEAPLGSIDATPREIHVILAEWRDAERLSRDAPPGSVEAEAAADRAALLRAEYRRAHEAASRRRSGRR